ncbi:hypothetical protein J437_LFUL018553 [Ladona fulva]|uniref:Reverse transcriptase n=1 Tax=Ladona fulva TaxID=123851 RepID=A0A8K0KQT5_LADFU|nr:hypothetical protein J437_LFUL018553 [Ladona fulva]
MTAREMQKVIDELFPTHPLRTDSESEIDDSDIPAFSMGELEVAVSSLKNRKTPGPDGIPAEILKETMKIATRNLLKMYNTCLSDGIFSTRWQRASLVLIHKGKGAINASSRYRPICLLEFDSKLSFWPQIKKSSDKVAATTVSLSRLMVNVVGPKQCKRKLLMAVVESQLLYGAEIWASALNTAKYRKHITVVQRRGALRVACLYRTVSGAAMLRT